MNRNGNFLNCRYVFTILSHITFYILLIGFSLNLHAQGSSDSDITQTEIDKKISELQEEVINRSVDPDIESKAGELIGLCHSIEYKLGIGRILMLVGSYHINQVNLVQAELFLDSAQGFYLDHDLVKDTVGTKYHHLLKSLGSLRYRQRSFQEAEDLLKPLLPIFLRESDTLRYHATLMDLGIIQGMQDNLIEALQYFTSIYESNPQDQTRSFVIGNIAICYQRMGQPRKALSFLLEGLEVDEALGYKRPHKYNTIGSIYNDLDQIDSSIYYTEKAVQIAKEINNYNSAVVGLSNLAQKYLITENTPIAESLMREALALADSVGIPDMQEKFDMVFASLAFQQGDYLTAIEQSKKALVRTSNFNNKRFSSHLAMIISESYEKLGRSDSALHYFKVHHALEDSLFNRADQRKYTELYARIENLEKQREIERLEQQNMIANLRNRLTFGGLGTLIIFLAIGFIAYRRKLIRKQQDLRKELELNQQKLSGHTLNMVYKNNGFTEIEEEIKKMRKQKEPNFQKILNIINVNKSVDKDWDNFNQYFSQVHPEFNERLLKNYPNLAQGDRRLAALVKMNLTNREMASILFIEAKSIRMAKYRLKKKLDLKEEDDLYQFLNAI